MLRPLSRLLKRQPIFRTPTRFSVLQLTLSWLWALGLVFLLDWNLSGIGQLISDPAPSTQPSPTPVPTHSTIPSTSSELSSAGNQLPLPAIHPLPPTLAHWQDTENQGDYFDTIEPTAAGYLIWSTFPIRVYIQPPDAPDITGRTQAWYDAVLQALQEWTVYLPLTPVADSESTDISIWRSAPPLQPLAPPTQPNQPLIDRLPRVRAAETRYEIFVAAPRPILSHRYTIHLSPNQTPSYTQATARHELGHALGIWGHSPLPTDALYFSQVRHSPVISHRDINTLKRIYEQPTRLGWELRNVE